MKFKITLLVMAGITLTSFNSCWVRVGGPPRAPRMHHERHGRGPRTYVQPENNGLQNSYASPSILQPSAELPNEGFTALNFD